MRLLLVVAMATALFGGAAYMVQHLGRGRLAGLRAQSTGPRARSYYALRLVDEAVVYSLPPGESTLRLRLRSVLGPGTAAPGSDGDWRSHVALSLKLLGDAGERLGGPLELVVPLRAQEDSGPAAARPVDPPLRRLSMSTSRLVTVTAPQAGGYLAIASSSNATPTLLRVMRREGPEPRGPGRVLWHRLAAKPTFGAVPEVVRVLEPPRGARSRQRGPDAPSVALQDAAGTGLRTTEVYALHPYADAAVELELVESVGGTVRLRARATMAEPHRAPATEAVRQSETARSSALLRYEILQGQRRVRSGELQLPLQAEPSASLCRHAVTLPPAAAAHPDPGAGPHEPGPHDPAAAPSAHRPASPAQAVSQALSRYLFYPRGADRLRLWAEQKDEAQTYVSFALWSGPTGRVPLARAQDRATGAGWRRVRASNHAALKDAGRVATVRTPRHHGPNPTLLAPIAGYEQLSPLHGARYTLLEPRRGPRHDTDVARLRQRGDSVCVAGPDKPEAASPRAGRIRLRLRLADASRLGHSVQVRLDSGTSAPVLEQTLVATAADLILRHLQPGCHPIFVSGLEPIDQLLTDVHSAPHAQVLAQKTVWEPLDERGLSFDVRVSRPRRVTLTAYPVHNAKLRLRLRVDGGAPRRVAAPLAAGFTPPLLERQVYGHDPIEAHVADDAAVRLAIPAHLSIPLDADLAPGVHRLDVHAAGSGRVFVRLSVRDEPSAPAMGEAEGQADDLDTDSNAPQAEPQPARRTSQEAKP